LLAYYSALLKIIYFIPYTLIAGGAAFYIFSIIYLENSLNGVLDATDGRSKTLTALKPIGGHLSLFWCFLGGIIIEIFLLFPLMLPRNILQFMAPRPSVAVVIVSSIFMALIYGLQLSWNLGLGHKIGTRYALLQEQLASLPPEGPAAKFK